MKKIALWLFRAAAVLGVLGWLVLFLFGADCLFFLEPDYSRTHCFAVSLYLYQLLLLPATVLSLAVAGAECNTVIELKPEHHAASPWHFA